MKKEKTAPEKILEPEIAASAAEAPVESHSEATPVNNVGRLLKEMRLQKGLKLNDIAKRLCIRAAVLEAIEASRYEEIPEPPYGLGFIRSYADYLGLNSSNIVELYKEETNNSADKDIYVLEPQSEATVPGKKYLLISLLGVIIIYLLWSVYNRNYAYDETVDSAIETEQNQAAELNVPDNLPLVVEDYSLNTRPIEAVKTEPDQEEQPQEAIAPTVVDPTDNVKVTEASFSAPEKQEAAAKPLSEPAKKTETVSAPGKIPNQGVFLKITKETWVSVRDADKLYISKVLQPGESYIVPDGAGMILSVGRVEGVDVYVNGKLTPVATNAKKTNIALDSFLGKH